MIPLSEQLRQARVEIDVWARLHDADMEVFRALTIIDSAVKALRHQETQPAAGCAVEGCHTVHVTARLVPVDTTLRHRARVLLCDMHGATRPTT